MDRWEVPNAHYNRYWARLNTDEWRCRTCWLIVGHYGPFLHTCTDNVLVQGELFDE